MFEKEAEDYAEKKICQEYNGGCTGFYRCKEYCERYHITQKHWKDGAEFGYRKANEWHNLRKDPDDLPTCDCETITLHENGNKNIQIWRNRNWTNAIVIPIVAWCEIPKFEEEA